MTELLRYPPPREREENTAWLGMLVFLGSWAMLFAGIFFAYGVVRASTHHWPPDGLPRLPIALPAANTLVIGLSSLALQMGYERLKKGAPAAASLLFVALALGTLFLALQAVLWTQVWRSGLSPDRGPYPSAFWALTGFHALHVAIGVGALVALAVRTALGTYNPARHLAVRLWAMYWHFVGAVWLLIFATVFVL